MQNVNQLDSNGQPLSPILMLDRSGSPLFSSEQQFLKYKQKIWAPLQEEPQQSEIKLTEQSKNHPKSESRQHTKVVFRFDSQFQGTFSKLNSLENQREISVDIQEMDQQKKKKPREKLKRGRSESLQSEEVSVKQPQTEAITRRPSFVSFKSGILNKERCNLQRRMSLGRPVVDPELEKKTMGIVKVLHDCGFQVNKPLIECVQDYCVRKVKLKSASHFYKFKKRFQKYMRNEAYQKFSPVSNEVRAIIIKRLREISGIYHKQFGKILVKSRPSISKWQTYFNLPK